MNKTSGHQATSVFLSITSSVGLEPFPILQSFFRVSKCCHWCHLPPAAFPKVRTQALFAFPRCEKLYSHYSCSFWYLFFTFSSYLGEGEKQHYLKHSLEVFPLESTTVFYLGVEGKRLSLFYRNRLNCNFSKQSKSIMNYLKLKIFSLKIRIFKISL